METVKGRSGGVLRIRGASPFHHEIRDTWTEQRGKFHRDSQSAVVLLSRRSRTHYTVPPSVRGPSASLRLGQGHRLEGGRKESHRHFSPSVSARPRPYLRSAVPAPVSRPSNEPSVRPSASVRCSCLRTGGERVECRKDVRSPESRPTASLPAERVLQRRTAASGPAKWRPADLHAKAFP